MLLYVVDCRRRRTMYMLLILFIHHLYCMHAAVQALSQCNNTFVLRTYMSIHSYVRTCEFMFVCTKVRV